MNSPSGGLMIKVGDGTPIGGLPPWIASDTVNGGLMFKVNAAGYTPPDGMLQTTAALSSSLQVVKDNLGNSSGLALATNYARFGVSGFWFITFNNSISHSAGNPLNINSDFGAITMGSGTITSNGLLTIKGAGSNILSLRDSSNVEKVSVTASGAGTFASSITSSSGISNFNQIQITGANIFFAAKSVIASPVDGNLSLQNNAGNSFSLLQLGGTTSSFPAIKRNAAAIDFRLADDSGYADINAGNIKVGADNASQYIYSSSGGGAVSAGFYLQPSTYKVSIYTQSSEKFIIDSLGTASFTPAAIALSAGATNPKELSLAYTINNSGAQTGTATGIFLNATETALNGMAHNLMDLQVGGVSQFRVTRNGALISQNVLYSVSLSLGQPSTRLGIDSPSNGILLLYDNTNSNFNRIQLGGQTSSFPAIKRNGAVIDFRLADDSATCGITCAYITAVDGTSRISTIRSSNINDDTNAITAINIANTTGKTTFFAPLKATGLPTTRPSVVGDLYAATAADILANGDKVIGIRV